MWRWSWALALAGSVAVAFGTLFYAFSVLLTDEAAGGDFSTTVLSIGYGGSLLMGGLSAYWIGSHVDRRGVRGVIAAGGVLAAAGLGAFAAAREPWQVLAALWLLAGPAGGMLFYEPAFVAVDQWFGQAYRARALATLTVVGGLAGPIFIPLTAWLVDALGWRTAAAALGATTAVAALVVAAVALPAGRATSGPDSARVPARIAGLLGDTRFVLFTAATFLVYGALQATFFHRIAVFEEAGFAVATVTLWAAASGVLSFPGRWGAAYLARRLGAIPLYAAVLVVQGAAVMLMVGGGGLWQMQAHFVVFGLMFGMVLPLRAVVMAEWYSGPDYGRIMGAQWSTTAVSGAAAAMVAGVLRDALGGYGVPMALIASMLLAAAVLTARSGRVHSLVSPEC